MIVAIIPARGGSKRIPRKNLRPFAGRPIIAYSIEAAHRAGCFDRIVVSTDSREIADLAVSMDAEVPFLRPAELSDDHATTASVLQHAIEALGAASIHAACCIYPTAPLLRATDLVTGLELLRARQAPSVVPVTTYEYNIFRSLRVSPMGTLEMIWPENRDVRSNDLPEALHDAGQFYWVDAQRFLREPVIFAAGTVPLRIPREIVQDIDTPEDWKRAEAMYYSLLERQQVG